MIDVVRKNRNALTNSSIPNDLSFFIDYFVETQININMIRSPEMMQVFISLKKEGEVKEDDMSLTTYSSLWGIHPQSIEKYVEKNVQAIGISALNPAFADEAIQLIEKRKCYHLDQEVISPEDEKYIPLLNLTAVYIGLDNYMDALNNMCGLARDIIDNCGVSLPGF